MVFTEKVPTDERGYLNQPIVDDKKNRAKGLGGRNASSDTESLSGSDQDKPNRLSISLRHKRRNTGRQAKRPRLDDNSVDSRDSSISSLNPSEEQEEADRKARRQRRKEKQRLKEEKLIKSSSSSAIDIDEVKVKTLWDKMLSKIQMGHTQEDIDDDQRYKAKTVKRADDNKTSNGNNLKKKAKTSQVRSEDVKMRSESESVQSRHTKPSASLAESGFKFTTSTANEDYLLDKIDSAILKQQREMKLREHKPVEDIDDEGTADSIEVKQKKKSLVISDSEDEDIENEQNVDIENPEFEAGRTEAVHERRAHAPIPHPSDSEKFFESLFLDDIYEEEPLITTTQPNENESNDHQVESKERSCRSTYTQTIHRGERSDRHNTAKMVDAEVQTEPLMLYVRGAPPAFNPFLQTVHSDPVPFSTAENTLRSASVNSNAPETLRTHSRAQAMDMAAKLREIVMANAANPLTVAPELLNQNNVEQIRIPSFNSVTKNEQILMSDLVEPEPPTVVVPDSQEVHSISSNIIKDNGGKKEKAKESKDPAVSRFNSIRSLVLALINKNGLDFASAMKVCMERLHEPRTSLNLTKDQKNKVENMLTEWLKRKYRKINSSEKQKNSNNHEAAVVSAQTAATQAEDFLKQVETLLK
ncbi:hypothetical protein MP638_000592 [Amoeboaphelidium occidentale]|nr:hypothetical protein MP638_000592 [Amoeboaphelidium occidentale]